MPFPYSNPPVELIPEGEYALQIETAKEGFSKGTPPQPQVTCNLLITAGPHKGKSVRFHRVTFGSIGSASAGIALGFLSAIGQPHEGEFEVNAQRWIGKEFLGFVEIREYNGKRSNQIKWVKASNEEAVDDGVPF